MEMAAHLIVIIPGFNKLHRRVKKIAVLDLR